MRRASILSLLAVICLLAACTHKRDTGGNSSAASPVETVTAIYEDLLPRYRIPMMPSDTANSLERKYCSKDWIRRREKEAEITRQTGEIICCDYDPWLSAQDWDEKLALCNVSEYKKLGADTVWVKVRLKNFGTRYNVFLILVHEDGEWRVDDFPYEWEDHWLSAKENLPE